MIRRHGATSKVRWGGGKTIQLQDVLRIMKSMLVYGESREPFKIPMIDEFGEFYGSYVTGNFGEDIHTYHLDLFSQGSKEQCAWTQLSVMARWLWRT